ncbi:pentapeptide repeat-containing protein [Streptomyces sp. NPDC086554]|uniref:pentapeptide repeat-containing protein n=1 Tax=Streptomyces sp. NPDC086554 TaxID=3154864 RepID=UPI00341C7F33
MSIRTWRRRVLVLMLIAVGGSLLVVSAVCWWGGPVLRALVPMARPDWATLDPGITAPAEALFRLAIIQASAAVGAVFVLWFTARNYRLTRRGQETDRFAKALERLGSHERYVRIGGVLAMDQIVEDAPGQATHAAQVLNAFIRDRAPRRPVSEPITRQRVTAARRAARHHATTRVEPKLALPQEPDADVQRALTMLTRPSLRSHVASTEVIDPSLHLTGAYLDGANLSNARLGGANLTFARLGGANFTGAQLSRVNFTDAQLDRADLRSADQLTVSQVVSAKPTKTIQLPPDIAADLRVIARIEEVEGSRESAA